MGLKNQFLDFVQDGVKEQIGYSAATIGGLYLAIKISDFIGHVKNLRKAKRLDQTTNLLVEIAGDWPNGATISTRGNSATIHLLGIDKASDLVDVFKAASGTGATKGVLHTGTVVNDRLLKSLNRYADQGLTFLGGKVYRDGIDKFRIVYDSLPKY
jgi:hypothetical protein